jgi:hypothetical protein
VHVTTVMIAETARKRKLSNGSELVREAEFKGFSFHFDDEQTNGPEHRQDAVGQKPRVVIGLSNRYSRDADRAPSLPSLDRFRQDLRTLEVYKNRYLINLPDSLVELRELQSLRVTRCSRLVALPNAMGSLGNLQVVRCTLSRGCGMMHLAKNPADLLSSGLPFLRLVGYD